MKTPEEVQCPKCGRRSRSEFRRLRAARLVHFEDGGRGMVMEHQGCGELVVVREL